MTRKLNPIRQLRRARAINQEDLARLVGVTQETISKAENGKIKLSYDVQCLIATVLGGVRADLFPEAEPVPVAVPRGE